VRAQARPCATGAGPRFESPPAPPRFRYKQKRALGQAREIGDGRHAQVGEAGSTPPKEAKRRISQVAESILTTNNPPAKSIVVVSKPPGSNPERMLVGVEGRPPFGYNNKKPAKLQLWLPVYLRLRIKEEVRDTHLHEQVREAIMVCSRRPAGAPLIARPICPHRQHVPPPG